MCVCAILGFRGAKVEVIWFLDVAPCGFYFSVLMTIVACPSETSVHVYLIARLHITSTLGDSLNTLNVFETRFLRRLFVHLRE